MFVPRDLTIFPEDTFLFFIVLGTVHPEQVLQSEVVVSASVGRAICG